MAECVIFMFFAGGIGALSGGVSSPSAPHSVSGSVNSKTGTLGGVSRRRMPGPQAASTDQVER